MKWISQAAAIAILEAQVAEHGGSVGLRDQGLLESALNRAQNIAAYETQNHFNLARLAAAYGYGLIKNHPFVDGNKQTALVVLETFLYLNDTELMADEAACVTAIIAVAEGTMDEAKFCSWIRANIKPLKSDKKS
jgi:death-on-curing protein